MNIRIDTSGNLLIGLDSASTTAKQFLLFLLSQLQANPTSALEYDDQSAIKDIIYDEATHELSWTENGSTQTYSMTTTDLQTYIGNCIAVIEPNEFATKRDVQDAQSLITSALGAVRQALSLEHAQIAHKLSTISGDSGDSLLTSQEFTNQVDEVRADLYSIDRKLRDLTAGGALVGAGLLVTQKPKQTRTK